MKRIFYSPVLAAVIISVGLVASAVIISRRDVPSTLVTSEQVPSEQVIKTQFVTQIKEQTGNSSYNVMGQKRVLDNVIIDSFKMSPKRNHVAIDYHLTWQGSTVVTAPASSINLIKDKFGRFDSGDIIVGDDKRYRVIVQ